MCSGGTNGGNDVLEVFNPVLYKELNYIRIIGLLYTLLLLVTQSCPTLCDRMDCSLPGSSVPGILRARTLEWAAISFSNAWKWKMKVKSLSCVWLSATPWTAAHQAPLSIGFSRQEYWSGVPLPSPFIYFRWRLLIMASKKHAQSNLEKQNTGKIII